ncbi:Receptor-type tyrosine-protein phosphatase F,Receptor-type tyrosine-protein phosphatase R,Tyrosine-protein phosphatase non-receptor type 12,Receptor-type tyrosine-protein phosphatase S,Receptor-type tyrosine-protein phosphatase beta,Receptor-type tyrosine-protein phosphatase alpha,Receptor-type tyrosine-protein phosphatase delta,Tyrosine-protein phosphatase corkscrew [Mytilus edulis]|uniref:protein-tyrosine-phosphatase n=1 Tax=Mytilus edulis TaxID=6550 RepID=A0A8S3TAC9_MYTED|nr:Receptor-type tyrosine-protein phosphatase F,Receptor-type tyrosine-protein phosphatase R,Tyrosine-protein phosphatase non-receptor type 12,Receptor-type tyrosine-protein phosphatase S,Receptor-type tyrosine-protein phosphatase beta,Receptor-type tyrosine-protein phosphatase alpha,Receptor-type tyrosine-protein phosphatase delta,Tyrosine-protein phosphatase corkscrew [Mytilus edulis]
MSLSLKLVLLPIVIETFIVTIAAQINLAQHGVAVQRTDYLNRPAHFAQVAIEGPANNKFVDGCSVTASGQTYAWWGLQLPAVAHMTNILIYYRENFAHRMDEFRLYLENGTADQSSASGLCYTDQGITGYPAITQNITCNMLAKNMYFVNRRSDATCFIELCYVAIYGCWKGFWGKNCTVPCPPTCIGQHCYPANGSCVWGCDHTNCMNKNCYKATGVCLGGCVFGQAGQYCNKYNLAYNQTAKIIPVGQSNARLSVDGLVSTYNTTADDGHVVYCSNTTDKWNDGILLYNGPRLDTDITIFAICKYVTYVPPMLSGNSMVELCEMEIGDHDPSPKPMNVFVNKGCDAYLEDASVSLPQKHSSKTSGCDGSEEIPQEYDEEYEGNVYGNVQTEADYKIAIADLKKILPRGLVHAHMEGSKEENKLKNRFLATWPYDHSRIVLTGKTQSDYINASFIDSYEKEKAYIASQGPKKNTIRDFWHMIWQEKVNTIVMVTKLEEERRKKCEQYWPQSVNKVMLVDNYRLVMKKEIQHTVYVYRLIILQSNSFKNKQERKIHHFHFTQWPDHGVPDSVKLVNFYRKVKSIKVDRKTPMVVHCSAGVGRTGTFIAIDALYEHGQKEGYVDIMEYVQTMRKDRMNMVQTHEQYEVVFEALLELFTVPDTSIDKSVFCEYIQKHEQNPLPRNQTVFREEFQRLQTLRPVYAADNYKTAKRKENLSKNSSKSVLANDNYRPYLMTYGRNRNDYINAVIVPGYLAESKLFVTQCPLDDTVIDFWTMMFDHGSRIIVLLDPANKGAPLWLEENEKLQFDDFSIIKDNENLEKELQITLNHTKSKETISINVFTAEDWTISKAPPSSQYMLDLLQRVQNCWETQKCPITVVCSDGCSKSGLFVTLKLVLEKMQIDEDIDIFQVVREIQTRRPEFLVELDQYEYIYKCIRWLLEKDSRDSLYANV